MFCRQLIGRQWPREEVSLSFGISRRVAKRIVDLLEVVYVKKQNRSRLLFFFSTLQGAPQQFVQKRAIRQAGKSIMSRQMDELAFRLVALGNVFDDFDDPRALSGLARYRKCPRVNRRTL